MHSQNLHRPLLPKITQITKEQFRKFRMVRKLNTEILGEHELCSCNGKKYICKELSLSAGFLTCRGSYQAIYQYNGSASTKYIFQLIGEPLSDLFRSHSGQEISSWIQFNNGFEESMISLIKFTLKLYEAYSLTDILYECFRVSDGQLYYCYDTWMRGTLEIVTNNNLDIEGYLISDKEMEGLQRGEKVEIGYREFLWKIGIFIIGLVMPEVKMRNYDYGRFAINQSNIDEKLRLFKIKVINKELIDLVTKFLTFNFQTMDQIWRLLEEKEKSAICQRSSLSKNISNGLTRSLSKNISKNDKENSGLIESRKTNIYRKNDKKCSENMMNNSCNWGHSGNGRKIRLKNRSAILDETLNHSVIHQEQVLHPNKPFNLKKSFSTPPQSNIKVLEYLNLQEHIIESIYESSIINSLEGIRIKSEWKHKVYQNGSIYLGDFNANGEKREGKGMYLFDSEDFYFGDWKDNMMHGFGTYVFRSGEFYCGGLRNGVKEGHGKFCYKDGRVYEGNWKENHKIGFGTVLFPNGARFLGFFRKNYNTFGIFTWLQFDNLKEIHANLESYEWETNSFSQDLCPNSDVFSTQFSKTKLSKCNPDIFSSLNCLSEASVLDGSYKGEVCEGKPHGFGIKKGLENEYEGNWKFGEESGEGKLTMHGKFEIEGKWEDGMLVEYVFH